MLTGMNNDGRTSKDERAMDVGQNGMEWDITKMNGWTTTMPTTTLQSDLRSRALWRWHVEERNVFLLLRVCLLFFSLLLLLLLELLQGLLTA